jgi:hypothetical protein
VRAGSSICRGQMVWSAPDVVAGPGPWFVYSGVTDWS